MNLRVNLLNKLFFPEVICNFSENENEIFLTFDDGPTPGITSQVLAFLAQFNAKATFFCRGDNVNANRDLYQNIIIEGHTTGNHGYSHLHGWYYNTELYVNDCNKAAEIIPNRIFRPPYGKLRPKQYQTLKKEYTIYLWTALSWDFHPLVGPEICLKYISGQMKSGAILVFHDSVKASSKLLFTLPRLLELGQKKGFRFSAIPINTKSDRKDIF